MTSDDPVGAVYAIGVASALNNNLDRACEEMRNLPRHEWDNYLAELVHRLGATPDPSDREF